MVLDMGKVEAGKVELERRPFHLSEVIRDARLHSFAAQKKGLVFHDKIGSLFNGPVIGDMPRVRQILTNLLANAIKFTGVGSVSLEVFEEVETSVAVIVRFVVEDTGIGIKSEAIPNLFQPFHQADASTARKYGGTGLGLCIAKNLAELMGGTIELQSTYGEGTKMTVTLPFEKAAGSPAASSISDASSPGWPGPQMPTVRREDLWILLAEDNELNSEIVEKTLKKMKFNVKAVKNGHEAVQAMYERRWDIVLMDGQMPNMDGYEATRVIRSSSDPAIRSTTIIALTASAIQGDREKCLEVGMNDYLAKPVRAKSMEEMILQHLSRKWHII